MHCQHELKKKIDSNYILNGSISSPLAIESTVTKALLQFIANEIFSQTNILIYEQFIDQEINDIYDLSESDIARMTEKMGVCAASIPVYASAWEAYCEEENCVELCEKINTAIVDYDDEQIAEIKEKIRNALFSKTNELEDFCKNNQINPITVWYFIAHEEVLPMVKAAVDFYNAHPNDTLILVTADHETGGMAIGYKTTNYDTFLTNLTHQKMSYAKFDSTYVEGYIANKTPFEAAMADVKANFGLTLPTDPDAASAGKLLLTDYEVENLRKAYERTLEVGAASQKEMSQQDYELYGTYIPFSMAICHTINHKSGMDHTTYAHTGAMVNIYALGVGAEKFRGVFDNTEIYHKLAELTGVQ